MKETIVVVLLTASISLCFAAPLTFITITSPQDGSYVNNTVLIEAQLTQIPQVRSVKFYIDNQLVGEDTTFPYQYNWDTIQYPDGIHQIYASVLQAPERPDIPQQQGLPLDSPKITVIVDNSPPTTPLVTDDGEYTNSLTTLHASWTASADSESGVIEYLYSIGTTKGGTDLINWTSVGTNTEITRNDLTLVGTKTYFINVKAKNGAGLFSQVGSSDGITINLPPTINNVIPTDNTTFLVGAIVNIQVNATDPNGDTIEYQFSIDGEIKQPWSNSPTYNWPTTSFGVGSHTITCQVRDNHGGESSQAITYHLENPTAEEVLQKVVSNYSLINDMKADMTLNITLNGKPFGDIDYCIYYFLKPNKEKTETYATADRLIKTDDTIIIDGSKLYLVNPSTKAVEEVNLLAEADITQGQFNQMDICYNLPDFLGTHTISKNDAETDFNNYLIAIDVIPNSQNNLYSRLQLKIDYKKGLLTKSLLFKDGNLIQSIETADFQQMSNGAWVPVTMIKKPVLSSGELITTMTYSNIKINIGLTELDFDPYR